MPLTGEYAWKTVDLSVDERVDRFFNVIDHAVENGVPLEQLYRREHIKMFLNYALQHLKEPHTNPLPPDG